MKRAKRLKLEVQEPTPRARRAHSGPRLQAWETPWSIVQAIERDTFNGVPFALDACATESNRKAVAHLDMKANGLRAPWLNATWFNPPYEEQERWLARAHWWARKGINSAGLVLASTSALYWRPLVWERAAVDFYEGRIAFVDERTGLPVRGNTYASALVLVGPAFLPGQVRVRSAETGKLISQLPHRALDLFEGGAA